MPLYQLTSTQLFMICKKRGGGDKGRSRDISCSCLTLWLLRRFPVCSCFLRACRTFATSNKFSWLFQDVFTDQSNWRLTFSVTRVGFQDGCTREELELFEVCFFSIWEIFRAMSTIQAVLEGIIKPHESWKLHFLKEPRKCEYISRGFHFCANRRENGNFFVNVLKAALNGLFQNLQCYFSNISGFANAMTVIFCV